MIKPSRPPEGIGLYALAGALMIGGPVWHYLFVNHYPFTRPEAVVLPLTAALLGAGLAAAAHRVGGWGATLGFGALLFLFADLQFDLEHWVIRTIAVVAGCVGLSWVFRARRAALVCLTLGAFDLASLPRAPEVPPFVPPSVAEHSLRTNPVLVHIILDEQWGIGGLRADGDTATARFLSDFYLQRGFEVYEAAYSRWHLTLKSIPGLMSLGEPVEVEDRGSDQYRVDSNPYFQRLRDLGYEFHVYQADYLDFCHAAGVEVAVCKTAPANTIANLGYLDGPWTTRALLTGRYFLKMTSYTYTRLRNRREHPVWSHSFAGRGLDQLRELRDEVAAGVPRGTAVFVHLLLPHQPLEVDGKCRLSDPQRRVYYTRPGRTDWDWDVRTTRYDTQVRCLHRAIAELLAAVDSTVGRDGAIVIIHGDHGPRIHRIPEGTRETLSEWDGERLNVSFSTLLAIRRPHVPAARHTEPVPVQDFFWTLVEHNFVGPVDGEWRHFVEYRMKHPQNRSDSTDTLRVLTMSEMPWTASSR